MTTLALDDHPMNTAMALLLLATTGAVVLALDFHALYYEQKHAERENVTLRAFVISFIWCMLVIFALGDSR